MSGSSQPSSRQEINTDKLQELLEENKDLQDCFESFD